MEIEEYQGKRNESWLGENNEVETKKCLQPMKWNTQVATPGAWHQYLSGTST